MSWFGDYSLSPLQEIASGQWYKIATQTASSGDTSVTFSNATSWSDTSTISKLNTTTFQVNKKGLYQLEFNVSNNANTGTWTNTLKNTTILITRPPTAQSSVLVQSTSVLTGISYNGSVTGTIALEVGDTIICRVTQTLTAGQTQIGAQSGASPIDLNTSFTWMLLKEL